MKTLRKLWIGVMLGVMTLMFSGCNAGSSVDTKLELNQDVSGSRVMEIAIVDSVFNENFNGTHEDLQALIKEKCPAQLSWSYEDGEETKKYIFTLAFSGLEDYQAKVNALCGEEKEITVTVADSIWSSGIYIQEGFTSQNLLDWLKEALVESEMVSSDNAGKIFSDGTTTVSYGGDSTNCGSQIYWNTVKYLKLNSITILTEVSSIDIYKMRAVIDVPKESMDAKGDEIRAFVNGCVPALGGMEELDNGNGGVSFLLYKEPVDVAGMVAFLSAVFGNDNASSVLAPELDFEKNPFVFSKTYQQTISLRNYIAGNNVNARFRYLVKSPEDIDVTMNGSRGYAADGEYSGYQVMADTYAANDDMNYEMRMVKTFSVGKLTVKTTQKGADKWERESAFVLSTPATEDELNTMVGRFETRMLLLEDAANVPDAAKVDNAATVPDAAKVDDGVSVEGVEAPADTEAASEDKKSDDHKDGLDVKIKAETKEGFSIVITQKGSGEELRESSQRLYGRPGSVTYANEGGFAKVTKHQAVVDELNYSALLNDKTADNFSMYYTLKLKGTGKITDTNLKDTEIVEQKNSSLEANFKKTAQTVKVYGTYTDLLAFLFWLLLILGVAMMGIAVLKVLSEGTKKKAAAAEAAPAAVQPAQEAPATEAFVPETPAEAPAATQPAQTRQEEEQADTPAFCENCGAKLESGAMFCENCGAKVER